MYSICVSSFAVMSVKVQYRYDSYCCERSLKIGSSIFCRNTLLFFWVSSGDSVCCLKKKRGSLRRGTESLYIIRIRLSWFKKRKLNKVFLIWIIIKKWKLVRPARQCCNLSVVESNGRLNTTINIEWTICSKNASSGYEAPLVVRASVLEWSWPFHKILKSLTSKQWSGEQPTDNDDDINNMTDKSWLQRLIAANVTWAKMRNIHSKH